MEFKRPLLKRSIPILLADFFFLLLVEAILFVCLFYYSYDSENPFFFLKVFGFCQFGIIFLFCLLLVIQDNDLLMNNHLLNVSPLTLKEKEVQLVEKGNSEEIIPYFEISSVLVVRQMYFRFQRPHWLETKYGKIILVTKDGKRHASGFVENPEEAKQKLEEKINNNLLSQQ